MYTKMYFKSSARRIFFNSSPFRWLFVLSPKSPTTPQRRHASELATFADFFEVGEEFVRLAFIRLNLVTALSRFRELEDLEF